MKTLTRDLVVPAISAKSCCGQALLRGIEQLSDQICFNATLSPHHVGEEGIREPRP
jgi:hypothetical protein